MSEATPSSLPNTGEGRGVQEEKQLVPTVIGGGVRAERYG
jgi:hypothetical protein